MSQIYFIGAGPGDAELITVKGARLLSVCDVVIIAGSLVNPDILKYAPESATIYDSSKMHLAEIVEIMRDAYNKGSSVARLHTGDPSLYGAILEQMLMLDEQNIPYSLIPGVTSLFAAAASLKTELTLPEISQTVLITRYAGRTPVPENFDNIIKAGGTLCLYLSISSLEELCEKLMQAGRNSDTPVYVVYRASWADEAVIKGTLSDIAEKVKESGISKHALILTGDVFRRKLHSPSKLYDKNFSHEYRNAKS